MAGLAVPLSRRESPALRRYDMDSIAMMLTFLSSSRDEQISALRSLPSFGDYFVGRERVDCLMSSQVLLIAFTRLIKRDAYLIGDEAIRERIHEIDCVIDLALCIGENVIGYHFQLEKIGSVPKGPFDGVWDVLRRLSSWCSGKNGGIEFDLGALFDAAEIKLIGEAASE